MRGINLKKISKKIKYFILVFLIFLPQLTDSSQSIQPAELTQCFIDAGAMYGIHPNLLWAIAKVESGFNPRAINKNANGTYDVGIMQINTSWLPVLKRYGLTSTDAVWDPCYNIYLGAWVLNQCIQKFGYTWEAVGCYNATSKTKRVKYSRKVWKALEPYIRAE